MDSVVERFLIPKFNELGMSASGEWLESLQTEARDNVGVIRGRDYSEFLARGRGPNHDSSPEGVHLWARTQGYAIMAKWIQDKGLSLNPFAVAYSVAMNGTKSYPKGSDLLEVLSSPECIDFVQNEFKEAIKVEVETAFKREIKNIFR